MRFVIELFDTDTGGIEGTVSVDGVLTAQAFSGWLELLRLLESRPRTTVGEIESALEDAE